MKRIGYQKYKEKDKQVTNEAYWLPEIREKEKQVTNEAYWLPKIREKRKIGNQ